MAIAIVWREAALESAFAPPLASHLRMNRAALTFSALFASMISVAELAGQSTPADAALHVLPLQDNRTRSEGMLRDYMRQESRALLARRTPRYESLKTNEEISAYQQELRARFVDSLGGFPTRTPLNSRVVGHLAGSGFRIEKIIFESQPGFFVTGLLYLPEGTTRPPVVLMPCGHTQNGKAGYQQPAITLAQNGLAVFCFDPIGQGERLQLVPLGAGDGTQPLTPAKPNPGEHMIAGVAPILLGRSLATYMIWDGIRAIDYLETRADLDARRLGCAGNSGGGMMTSYLMALEPRIVSAAPSCFMTTSERKNERPGPGDAEQNIHAQYVYGLDHPDFLILHAPRPVLIGTATRDYVPIEGAWEAFRQAKRVYTRMGYAEHVDLIETDAPHGFSVQIREGVTRWMRRWLLDRHDAVFERASNLLTDRELDCTPQGQVHGLSGARSIFDLNREEATRLAGQRSAAWKGASEEERRRKVRATAGIRSINELRAARVERHTTVQRGSHVIQKTIIHPEDGIALPALHYVPSTPNGRSCLYLHGRGKHVDAAAGGPIETMVREGTEVFAVDLRGIGETAMQPWRTSPAEVAGNNGAEAFVAYMMGRSLAGMRAEDTLLAAKVLATFSGGQRRVELVALEDAAVGALHAAAIEPSLFSSVRVVRAIESWERIIESGTTRRQFESVVHGALRLYDLSDLATLAGDVTFVEPMDASGRPAGR